MRDASSESIVRAAGRFCAGTVVDQSLKFAPSVAEFAQEVARCAEFLELQARPRIAAPRYTPGPLAPFELAKQKALAANSHLPVLFEGISYDEWRKLSLMRQIPVGAKWVASLATVYGPAKAQTQAA